MTLSQTYLNYPTDWTMDNRDEAQEFAEGADVLIFQEVLFKVPGMKLDKLALPDNTIIYGLGSMMRSHLLDTMNYMRNGYHVLPPLSDPTIAQWIGGAPFEAIIVDSRIEDLVKGIKRNKTITISHAPTKEMKGEETFEKIVKELGVEWMVVKGKSWEEAIKERAKAQIMLDSLGDVSYGLACLEGLMLGQEVISNISPWCYALHPNLPMKTLWKKDEKQIAESLIHAIITCKDERDGALNIKGQRKFDKLWVENHFSPGIQARNWERYIEFAIN